MSKLKQNNLSHDKSHWRWLVNVWTVITLSIFILDFISGESRLIASRCTLGIIYIAVLSIYVGTKEFDRWITRQYASRYAGERFVILWTALILIMVVLTIFNPRYTIPTDVSTVYITVLSIFAISRRSRYLYQSKNKK
jgi:hypothetical protein